MIERAEFGRTGHLSTRTLFGAAALSSVTQAEAALARDGITKVGDLRSRDETALVARYGAIGRRLYRFAHGRDPRFALRDCTNFLFSHPTRPTCTDVHCGLQLG